jgi:maleylpyruvate isomerase
MLRLYSYFRSSAAYRVRIALGLKGLDKEIIPVNLLTGEQQSTDYRAINPQGLVPALSTDGNLLTQSLAIIEYLEETCPEPPLLPNNPVARAQVRSLAHQIAMDIHPLNNLRVLKYLEQEVFLDETARQRWYQHWIGEGFRATEASLCDLGSNGKFCVGQAPSLADICLVPQVYNARRYNCDLSPYPLIVSVDEHCNGLPAFQEAAPESHPPPPVKSAVTQVR